MKKTMVFLTLSLAVLVFPMTAMAAVSGPCSDCHTMHNSQNAEAVVAETSGALTIDDCVGCHTSDTAGDNLGGTEDEIPMVDNLGDPVYGTDGTDGATLAGGSFYWVKTNNAMGHNVAGIASADSIPPPGYDGGRPDKDGNRPGNGTWAAGTQVTCAGEYGCHGEHNVGDDDYASIRGGHHADDSTLTLATVAESYRFLYGIDGIEDSDWEYQPTATQHNQYFGKDRANDTTGEADTDTISYLCAQCHGQFHNAATAGDATGSASPWLRHPTDFDLARASGTEYQYYNGGNGTADYSVVAPVASDDLTGGVRSTVTVSGTADGTAIVTCISCHRAHGTPYADLLRWDYDPVTGDMKAGSGAGNVGCFICHTTKDDVIP